MSSIRGGRQAPAPGEGAAGVCDPAVAADHHYHELQAELEYRLLVLVDQLRARTAVVAAELGLTPQQALLLRHLGRPRTMGEIAVALACDRSNVTGLVDRLAARGLVERVVDADDRRIKHLWLTAEGQALRTALQKRFFAESPATAGLPPSERRELLLLLRKLTPESDPHPFPLPCAGEGVLTSE
jgi:MarR family transcriptional regulator, organic hydroperoxide resistance regulator